MYSPQESEKISRMVAEEISNTPYYQLLIEPRRILTPPENQHFDRIEARLLRGEPIQYILGKAWFYKNEFRVGPGVLIPRPETEEMVAWIAETLKGRPSPEILDIGTGSGCIPISLKLEFPQARVWGMDISPEALEIAATNARLLKADVTFFQADALDPELQLPFAPSLDIVVSNPPYIQEGEKAGMHPNVTDFEPLKALFVPDQDPLIFYRTIARQALHWLKPGALLFFEINEAFGPECLDLFNSLGYSQTEIKKDFQGKDRMLKGTRP